MMRKFVLFFVVFGLLLGVSGCGGGESVPVQRADQLAVAGRAQERYAGMVVSEHVEQIFRDPTKRVEELYVEVGQEVKAGDKLFSYNSDELELELEKTQLEVEKMTNEQATYAEQQKKLEKELAKTRNESEKTRLTLEINTLKTTIMENDYNLKAKNKAIENLQDMLQNIDIVSPVDGTVRKIDEQSQDGVYITVQQTGAYRIQGMINEMSMGNGLMVGSRVQAFSRVSDQTWTGTVSSIETEDASQNNADMWNSYGMVDTMTTASSYVFYVELDSVEGLLLGQHVYVELIPEMPAMEGLWIPEGFLTEITMDEETFETTAVVFADNGQGRLEQRTVALGMFDGMTGCYEILSGIEATDYLADPSNPGCESGAGASRREPEDFSGGGETQPAIQEETAEVNDSILPTETQPEYFEGQDMVG